MFAFWQFLNAPQNIPFMIALVVMGMLFVLEILSLVMGGINDWIDGLLPDGLIEPAHPEMGLDAVDAGGFVRFLSWLYVGRVPLLMLMVLFLTVFGLLGLLVQSLLYAVLGFYLPSVIAAILTIFISLPIVQIFARGLYKILPKDETSAIDSSQLIGRIGVIVIGSATPTQSAQVRVKDTHGQTHYVMAYSDDGQIGQGETVLLVAQDEKVQMYFRVIKNTSAVLVD